MRPRPHLLRATRHKMPAVGRRQAMLLIVAGDETVLKADGATSEPGGNAFMIDAGKALG